MKFTEEVYLKNYKNLKVHPREHKITQTYQKIIFIIPKNAMDLFRIHVKVSTENMQSLLFELFRIPCFDSFTEVIFFCRYYLGLNTLTFQSMPEQ